MSAVSTRKIPHLEAKSWLVALGLALGTFALSSPVWLPRFSTAVALVGGERVLAGDIPYRDFWTIYAPGSYYLLAGLFGIFGVHNLVSVVAGTLLSAGAVGLSYLLVLRVAGRQATALATAMLVTAAIFFSGYGLSLSGYPPALFCILVGLNLFVLYLDGGRRRHLLAAGLAVGLAAVFKHDVGAYTALSVFAGLSMFLALRGRTEGWAAGLTALLSFGLAAALPVLLVALALAPVAARQAFQDLIVFPATDFRQGREDVYPSLLPIGLYDPWRLQLALNWARYFAFALPFAIWLASLPLIALAIWRRRSRIAGLGVTFALGFWFHHSAAQLNVNTHIITISFYAACLGALMLHWLATWRQGRRKGWLWGPALLVAALWTGALSAGPLWDLIDRQRLDSVTFASPKTDPARLTRKEAAVLSELRDFVQRCVPPGTPIYVGTNRHDIVIIGKVLLYFILDRPPATVYHELHGSVADTAPVQKEIIEELTGKDVQLLVLARLFTDEQLTVRKAMKQAALPHVGATDLDRFIHANYERVAQFQSYAVWLKRPVDALLARCQAE